MVLYINGNYPHHSLHSELVNKLAELGNDIIVFVPMKGKELEGNHLCDHPGVKVIYNDCLDTKDRVFFIHKIRKIVRQIEKTVDMSCVDCILTGTVYSDGIAGFCLNQKYHIPFSVAVRETDITYQMKWRPYLNGLVKKLLNNASNVIFISPTYQKYLERFKYDFQKNVIIPNAVNDFWFQKQRASREQHNPLSLIYVGEISKRKNVYATIRAMAELKRKQIPTVFHIVGTGDEEFACRDLTAKLGLSECVFFHGWQNDKEKIREFYDLADVFVMPSLRETFGTVYIEALSQGLPIIYTKGQGIDGYFDEGEVGFGCIPTDTEDIASKVEKIINSYELLSKQCLLRSNKFKWTIVANGYNAVIQKMRRP